MSVGRMTAVWEKSEHKGSALILMLAIADNADDFGVAWPGYEHLAWKCRMSRRSIIRLASTCADSGELWMLHRARQRSNVYVVTVGLSLVQLEQAAIRASKLGALPPTGSDILTPPPQVLVVVNKPQEVSTCHQVVIPGVSGSDTAMSPDPSVPIINHHRTIIEPPTPQAVDADVLAQLQSIGISGRKATALISAYDSNGELEILIPRLSEWVLYLDKQPKVTNPIGLAITKTEQHLDPPDSRDDYWSNLADEKRRRRYIEGQWADIIEH